MLAGMIVEFFLQIVVFIIFIPVVLFRLSESIYSAINRVFNISWLATAWVSGLLGLLMLPLVSVVDSRQYVSFVASVAQSGLFNVPTPIWLLFFAIICLVVGFKFRAKKKWLTPN